MTTVDELKEADWRRRQAMIECDAGALEGLLAEDLIWTHSSGKTDGKRSIIDKIASKTVRYLSLEVADDVVSSHGEIMIHHGVLEGRVSADGRERPLRNRFLSVWKWSGRSFELLAWQSTGL
jgi:ketosteroid isomerase-like protein